MYHMYQGSDRKKIKHFVNRINKLTQLYKLIWHILILCFDLIIIL